MRKIILTAFVALAALGAQAKGWTQEQVDATIVKVNNYWQQHNKAEVRSFWDNAAYHTGNMEAYKLLGKTEWIDYSTRWRPIPPSGSIATMVRATSLCSSATGRFVSKPTSTSTG